MNGFVFCTMTFLLLWQSWAFENDLWRPCSLSNGTYYARILRTNLTWAQKGCQYTNSIYLRPHGVASFPVHVVTDATGLRFKLKHAQRHQFVSVHFETYSSKIVQSLRFTRHAPPIEFTAKCSTEPPQRESTNRPIILQVGNTYVNFDKKTKRLELGKHPVQWTLDRPIQKSKVFLPLNHQ